MAEIYERLGVRRVINAYGTMTTLGGVIMPPEVLEAMAEASKWFVDLRHLLGRAGQRVAELAGVEAAYITSGASAGLVISTAACITGEDPAKIGRLPDTTGMKNEVIIHRCQRNVFDRAILTVGVRFVEIGLPHGTQSWELEAAINERTAAIVYFPFEDERASIPLSEVIRIAKGYNVPTIVDAAAELPPVSNLHAYNDMGADLVIFSGGKMIGGPQSTGLILGRKDLIRACALNGNPNFAIGRPMKVGKEEIIGLLTALELFVDHDFDADLRRWERQVAYFIEVLSDMPEVTVLRVFPGQDENRPGDVPRAHIEFDPRTIGVTPAEVAKKLMDGNPSIAVGYERDCIVLNPIVLEEGQEHVVGQRVKEVLESAMRAHR